MDLLTRLLPPPSEPVGRTDDWSRVAESWGTAFPSDYRDFLAVYGAGTIDDHLLIATASPDLGETTLGDLTSVASRVTASEDDDRPYPVWPEPGGLICWGATVDAAALHWDTSDADPDRWPVIVRSREGDFTRHDCGFAEFVVRMLGPSAERPLESPTLYGAPNSRFLSATEQRRLKSEGTDPWEYLEELYEANEADDYDADDGLLIMWHPDGTEEVIPGGTPDGG
ncbi:hypothetical protein GTW40_06555 [Streptomyces sp. SID4985]|uniref:SMI1/KNR4 family protein n=1 Tax=Streptomyces sp. SID4985 TaxID=2690292 RepID=UPI00136E2CBD|nr:SMI1/KNR4 family protein [Streptomyces sp. SID4985]MYQ44732.1 hypothetical protein [Streptomyces sp. SID4985]